ncbi:hypothetical protein BC829DRAFT_395812, partial [Chytridium lagenaria]
MSIQQKKNVYPNTSPSQLHQKTSPKTLHPPYHSQNQSKSLSPTPPSPRHGHP